MTAKEYAIKIQSRFDDAGVKEAEKEIQKAYSKMTKEEREYADKVSKIRKELVQKEFDLFKKSSKDLSDKLDRDLDKVRGNAKKEYQLKKKYLDDYENLKKKADSKAPGGLQGMVGKATPVMAGITAGAVGIGVLVDKMEELSEKAREVETTMGTLKGFEAFDMSGVDTQMIEIAKKTGQAVPDIMNTMVNAVDAGIVKSKQDVDTFGLAIDKFATASSAKVSDFNKEFVDLMNTFELGASETENLADKFRALDIEGVFKDTKEMVSTISTIAPAFKSAGASLDDMMAITASMTSQGVEATKTAAAIKSLSQGIKQSATIGKLKELGVRGIDYSTKEVSNLKLLLSDIQKVGIEAKSAFRGVDVKVLIEKLASTDKGFDVMSKKFENTAGAMSKQFNIMANTAEVENKRIAASMEELEIVGGKAWINMTSSAKAFAIEALGSTGNMVAKLKDMIGNDLENAMAHAAKADRFDELGNSIKASMEAINTSLVTGETAGGLEAIQQGLGNISEVSPGVAIEIQKILNNQDISTAEKLSKVNSLLAETISMTNALKLKESMDAASESIDALSDGWSYFLNNLDYFVPLWMGVREGFEALTGIEIQPFDETAFDKLITYNKNLEETNKKISDYREILKDASIDEETRQGVALELNNLYSEQLELSGDIAEQDKLINDVTDSMVKSMENMVSVSGEQLSDDEKLAILRQQLVKDGIKDLDAQNKILSTVKQKVVVSEAEKNNASIIANIKNSDKITGQQLIAQELEKLKVIQAENVELLNQLTLKKQSLLMNVAGADPAQLAAVTAQIDEINTKSAFNNKLIADLNNLNSDNSDTLSDINDKKNAGVELSKEENKELEKANEESQKVLDTEHQTELIKAELNGLSKDSAEYKSIELRQAQDMLALLEEQGASELDIAKQKLAIQGIEKSIIDAQKKQIENVNKKRDAERKSHKERKEDKEDDEKPSDDASKKAEAEARAMRQKNKELAIEQKYTDIIFNLRKEGKSLNDSDLKALIEKRSLQSKLVEQVLQETGLSDKLVENNKLSNEEAITLIDTLGKQVALEQERAKAIAKARKEQQISSRHPAETGTVKMKDGVEIAPITDILSEINKEFDLRSKGLSKEILQKKELAVIEEKRNNLEQVFSNIFERKYELNNEYVQQVFENNKWLKEQVKLINDSSAIESKKAEMLRTVTELHAKSENSLKVQHKLERDLAKMEKDRAKIQEKSAIAEGELVALEKQDDMYTEILKKHDERIAIAKQELDMLHVQNVPLSEIIAQENKIVDLEYQKKSVIDNNTQAIVTQAGEYLNLFNRGIAGIKDLITQIENASTAGEKLKSIAGGVSDALISSGNPYAMIAGGAIKAGVAIVDLMSDSLAESTAAMDAWDKMNDKLGKHIELLKTKNDLDGNTVNLYSMEIEQLEEQLRLAKEVVLYSGNMNEYYEARIDNISKMTDEELVAMNAFYANGNVLGNQMSDMQNAYMELLKLELETRKQIQDLWEQNINKQIENYNNIIEKGVNVTENLKKQVQYGIDILKSTEFQNMTLEEQQDFYEKIIDSIAQLAFDNEQLANQKMDALRKELELQLLLLKAERDRKQEAYNTALELANQDGILTDMEKKVLQDMKSSLDETNSLIAEQETRLEATKSSYIEIAKNAGDALLLQMELNNVSKDSAEYKEAQLKIENDIYYQMLANNATQYELNKQLLIIKGLEDNIKLIKESSNDEQSKQNDLLSDYSKKLREIEYRQKLGYITQEQADKSRLNILKEELKRLNYKWANDIMNEVEKQDLLLSRLDIEAQIYDIEHGKTDELNKQNDLLNDQVKKYDKILINLEKQRQSLITQAKKEGYSPELQAKIKAVELQIIDRMKSQGSSEAEIAAVIGAFNIPKFERGGYTGNEVGIVHPKEFVLNKSATDYLGVDFLDRLNTSPKAMMSISSPAGNNNVGGDTVNINIVANSKNEIMKFTQEEFEKLWTKTREKYGIPLSR